MYQQKYEEVRDTVALFISLSTTEDKMDLWMLYESGESERAGQRSREQQQRVLDQTDPRQGWSRRTALRCGLLLLRWSRRLIRYGRPQPYRPSPALSTLRRSR